MNGLGVGTSLRIVGHCTMAGGTMNCVSWICTLYVAEVGIVTCVSILLSHGCCFMQSILEVGYVSCSCIFDRIEINSCLLPSYVGDNVVDSEVLESVGVSCTFILLSDWCFETL